MFKELLCTFNTENKTPLFVESSVLFCYLDNSFLQIKKGNKVLLLQFESCMGRQGSRCNILPIYPCLSHNLKFVYILHFFSTPLVIVGKPVEINSWELRSMLGQK